jgi:hypothetical protein
MQSKNQDLGPNRDWMVDQMTNGMIVLGRKAVGRKWDRRGE